MKKLFLAFAVIAALVGCNKGDDAPVVYNVALSAKSAKIFVGDTQKLEATITPEKAVEWIWQSDNTDVAVVSTEGVVSAVAAGKAQITVSVLVNGTLLKESCDVEVVEKPTIELDKAEADVYIGRTLELVATVTPAETAVEWHTSDVAVATVENGVVRGLAAGEATITATVAGGAFAECKVTVKKPAIALVEKIAEVGVGYQITLTAVAAPSDAAIEWTSSADAVASVDDKGVVTGVAVGEATIKATIEGGAFAECKVTVKKSYQIGEIIDFGTEKGIVFYVDEGGTTGKAVSFTEKLGLLWAQSGTTFNCAASSEDDGEFNTDKIKQVGIEYHPAAKWCTDLGNGWYLPAISEGIAFVTKAATLNPILASNGGTEIKDSGMDWYWSSTEGEDEPNYEVICFYGGTGFMHSYGDYKTSPEYENLTRAVHKF